ncbi:MAG: 3'(2'),5'-bisphosphate nucleotidase CysQ [Devosiaceae bacterium]|nr:3'(2'),5'-bisphosphate nucleotidase CysQ [Devosiaceae bacterium MH13]
MSDTLPPVSVLCDAAREAGEIALRYFGNSPKQWLKAGNSPVTEADLAIDRMLHTRLRQAYPSFGWLSEEIEDDGSRLSGAPTFIVDPIDGTRGFMAGQEDWAVSIALVSKGEPAAGVLFKPVTGEMLYASTGHGSHLETADGLTEALAPSQVTSLDGAYIAHPGPALPHQTHRKAPRLASLALRLAAVASGTFDGCVAGRNAKDWDIAAADCIARQAGVKITGLDGAQPRYDRQSVSHPVLVCGNDALLEALIGFVPKAQR